jgi:hypothetical protein
MLSRGCDNMQNVLNLQCANCRDVVALLSRGISRDNLPRQHGYTGRYFRVCVLPSAFSFPAFTKALSRREDWPG